MVRNIMETIYNGGISDPTSPAKNYMERINWTPHQKWIENNGRKITIVGRIVQFLLSQPKFDTLFQWRKLRTSKNYGYRNCRNDHPIKWFIDTKRWHLQVVEKYWRSNQLKDYK
jgi:hypothetical protein